MIAGEGSQQESEKEVRKLTISPLKSRDPGYRSSLGIVRVPQQRLGNSSWFSSHINSLRHIETEWTGKNYEKGTRHTGLFNPCVRI